MDLSSTTNVSWKFIEPSGTYPRARMLHSFTFIDDFLFIFGGGPWQGNLGLDFVLSGRTKMIEICKHRFFGRLLEIQVADFRLDKLH